MPGIIHMMYVIREDSICVSIPVFNTTSLFHVLTQVITIFYICITVLAHLAQIYQKIFTGNMQLFTNPSFHVCLQV